MSATQIDHMGAPPFTGGASCTETPSQALSPCKPKEERQRRAGESMSATTVCVFLLHTRGRGSRVGGVSGLQNCTVLNKNAEEASMRRMK